MKISIVLGTRPEIIKMSSIIRELEEQHSDYFVLHTGQHYSYNLDKIFFEELDLPAPSCNLDVGSGSHAEEIGKMFVGLEKKLGAEKPDVVLVQGDTNTVFAGAFVASRLGIGIGHVEAGLRSFDRNMPEEINRVLTDHISDYLFAPTETAQKYLLKEGIPLDKIFITGNTIVDAVHQNVEIAKRKVDVLNSLELNSHDYMLVTSHRQENVDNEKKLRDIFKGLHLVYEQFGQMLLYPMHPRTMKRMKEFGLQVPEGIRIVEPVGFLEFLQLEANASLILTDSGGIQEESCILGVPCVTLRENTERPETITVGSNVLVGTDPQKILDGAVKMFSSEKKWENPYGGGETGKKILDILQGALE